MRDDDTHSVRKLGTPEVTLTIVAKLLGIGFGEVGDLAQDVMVTSPVDLMPSIPAQHLAVVVGRVRVGTMVDATNNRAA